MAMDHKVNLLGMDRVKLESFCVAIDEKPFRAQQLLKWIHAHGVVDFEQMTNLSQALRRKLSQLSEVKAPEMVCRQDSSDGTSKWCFQLPEGGAIESVYIPDKGRATLCLSSQVGCSLNCRFCHTAHQGFQRNLSASEIIGQLWLIYHTLLKEAPKASDGRVVTNVVMMGMGEPLLNFNNLLLSLNIMRDDLAYGLSKWRVTVSTSGVVPAIDRLAQVSDVSLAVSLHAPNDILRTRLMPINKKYSLNLLLDACRRYVEKDKRRKITIEYVMLKGVNDTPSMANELVALLGGLPSKVNLIPFNPFRNTIYTCSDFSAIERFSAILQKAGFITTTRKVRGQDINAACGQLAGEVNDRTTRSIKMKNLAKISSLTHISKLKIVL